MLKMNVGSVKTRDYGNERVCRLWENKPKTNPIKPNFKPGALYVNSFCFSLFLAQAIIWQKETIFQVVSGEYVLDTKQLTNIINADYLFKLTD